MDGAVPIRCPNCAYPLVTLRQEVQQAGHREVALHWLICPDCGHVALHRWGLVGPVPSDSRLMREAATPGEGASRPDAEDVRGPVE